MTDYMVRAEPSTHFSGTVDNADAIYLLAHGPSASTLVLVQGKSPNDHLGGQSASEAEIAAHYADWAKWLHAERHPAPKYFQVSGQPSSAENEGQEQVTNWIAEPASRSDTTTSIKVYASWSQPKELATYPVAIPNNLIAELALQATAMNLLATAQGEEFMTGFSSRLSRKLERFMAHHGDQGIKALMAVIQLQSNDPDITVEALTTVGRFTDPDSRQQRTRLLVAALTDSRAYIRRGSLIGLSHLDDQSAASDVQRLLDREQDRWVRNMAVALLDQLTSAHV